MSCASAQFTGLQTASAAGARIACAAFRFAPVTAGNITTTGEQSMKNANYKLDLKMGVDHYAMQHGLVK